MSNNSIIFKKSSITGRVPTVNDLQYGEFAINYTDGKLYYKTSTNTISYIGSSSLFKDNNLSELTDPSIARTNLGFGSVDIGFGNHKLTSVADPSSAQDAATKSYVDQSIAIGANSTAYARFIYTTTEGQTQFTAQHIPGNVEVWLDGFKLVKDIDFDDTNTGYITLTEPAVINSIVEIIAFNSFSVANTYTKAEVNSAIANVTTSYSHQYALSNTTTDATETELFINGTYNTRIAVPINKGISYTIDIIGRSVNIVGEIVYLTLKGAAFNNAGTTTDIGSIYEVVVARTDANFLADCRADNATDSIKVYVTGAAGKTITWKAVVTTIEL